MNIVIDALSFSYKKENILEDVRFEAQQGDVIAIIGNNGCGKTTLLKLIGGFLIPNKGKITFQNMDNHNQRFICSGSFETPHFWDYMTGLENAQYFLEERFNKNEVEDAFRYWKLEQYQNKLVKNYSLGMRQKLMLMICFLSKAPIMLLDEPTNSLDQQSIKLFYDMIHTASKEGRIVIFTTHVVYELENNCSQLYIIRNKKIVNCDREKVHNEELYIIEFDTVEDMNNAVKIIGQDEVVEIMEKSVMVIEKSRRISEIIRLMSRYNILTVMRKGKLLYDDAERGESL